MTWDGARQTSRQRPNSRCTASCAVRSPTQAGSSSGASSDGENIAALPVSQEKGKLREGATLRVLVT
ncbi:hypothetical protein HaLaN_24213, partial [Haematococcus lacustris]